MQAFRYFHILFEKTPELRTEPRMPMSDRAAQFASFAALTEHETAILETARYTESMAFISSEEQAVINEQLCALKIAKEEEREVVLTYFQPDSFKSGGSYQSKKGVVSKVNETFQYLEFSDGIKIPFRYIYLLESNLKRDFFDNSK